MITQSLIIPVYKNAKNLDSLTKNLNQFLHISQQNCEVVFVVDGNPENEYQLLQNKIRDANFDSQLILHSRNFGSFAAIRTGLQFAKGKYLAVMSADEQEPLSLINDFFTILSKGKYELVVGTRTKRSDPWYTTLSSAMYWKMYKFVVNSNIPEGGVDVFGCSSRFRDELLKLTEVNASLVGQLYWLGFERATIFYERKNRTMGKSAWTFSKKLKYMVDSIFSFTDIPLRILLAVGCLGVLLSIIMAFVILVAKSMGEIPVPGYSSTFLIVTFFGSINLISVAIVGLYMYRTYENTMGRPLTIVSKVENFTSTRK